MVRDDRVEGVTRRSLDERQGPAQQRGEGTRRRRRHVHVCQRLRLHEACTSLPCSYLNTGF